MLNKTFHTKAHFYLAILIAFCLPFARLTPIFIALMLLNWLLEGDLKNKFQIIYKNKFALLFIAFYGMHLIGMLYTKNINSGWFDLQVKFSLLLFSIILSSRPFNNKDIDTIFLSFIGGGVLSSIILLGRAIYLYITLGSMDIFFYQAFAFFLHPSYLSMYLNVAIVWLLIKIVNNKFASQRFSNFLAFLIILFFSFIIALLSSKIGLITMILTYICFLMYFIISKKKYIIGISGILIIIISIYYVMRFVPEINARVSRAISVVT